MIEVLTSFCARLYGRRSARNRAKKALRAWLSWKGPALKKRLGDRSENVVHVD